VSIIFGPINSRRFGNSLGVDLSPNLKQCNFDCLYCELSPAKTVANYSDIISVDAIINELVIALERHKDIDVITLTANGEPTLYPHLLELIETIKGLERGKRLMILSNGGTIDNVLVQNALMKLDVVKLSLDCATQQCLKKLDRAIVGLSIENILHGMLEFGERYHGELIIEVLLVKGVNDNGENIKALSDFLLRLQPTRIDLGTIDRPPAYDVKPLSYPELYAISQDFDPTLPIYIASRKNTQVTKTSHTNEEILTMLSRRPLTPEDTQLLFDDATLERLNELIKEGKIEKVEKNQLFFYKIIKNP